MSDRVRKANLADVDDLEFLGREFHALSPYRKLPYEGRAVNAFLLDIIGDANSAIFVSLDDDGEITGAAGITITPLPFSHTAKLAAERFWFVTKSERNTGIGFELKDLIEQWATDRGCAMVALSSFNGKAPRGYKPYETSFVKRLG